MIFLEEMEKIKKRNNFPFSFADFSLLMQISAGLCFLMAQNKHWSTLAGDSTALPSVETYTDSLLIRVLLINCY